MNTHPLRGRLAPVAKPDWRSGDRRKLSAVAVRLGNGLASCRRPFKEELCGASATPEDDAAHRARAANAFWRGYAGRRAGWLCKMPEV